MDWIGNLTRRVFSWFSQREVKTPLAFFFRIVGAVTLVILVALAFTPPDLRFKVFLIGMAFLTFVTILVFLFALVKPKNLVYGEAGYRAETRFNLGTEKREIGPSEIATMEGTANPKTLPSGGDAA